MTDSRHYAHLSGNGALRWTPGTFSKAGGKLNRIQTSAFALQILHAGCLHMRLCCRSLAGAMQRLLITVLARL
jgi:hypothetical protein